MLSRSRASLRPIALLALSLLGVQAHAIIDGTTANNALYQYMGTMSNGFSATPIAPGWLVTANHVGESSGTYTNADGTFSILGEVNLVNSDGVTGSDISLIQVGSYNGGPSSFTHYYGYGGVATSPSAGANGTTVTLAGIGSYSSGIGVQPGGGAGLTTATNTVDTLVGIQIDNTVTLAYAYDLDDATGAHNLYGSATGTPGEGGIAGGDSGGGWFVNEGGALPVIVATSSGVNPPSVVGSGSSGNYWDAGGVGYGGDLYYYSPQIQRYTGVAPVPFYPTPEPTAYAAFGLGVLAVLRRRRRS